MTRRGVMWGSGVAVVLGTAMGAMTNYLGGNLWVWIAVAATTLLAAGLAVWLASRPIDGPADDGAGGVHRTRVGRGAVVAGRDITGAVVTRGDTGDE